MTANSFSSGTIGNTGRNAAYITIDGVAVGYSTDGFVLTPDIGLSSVQFNEDSSPQGEKVDTQTVTIDVTLSEVTDLNFKYYLAGLADDSGATLYYGDNKGDSLTTFEVKLFPLHADHPWEGRVFTFHKCTIKPNGSLTIDPTADGFEGFPIQINVLKDSTQSAGQEFFSITSTDTTAPTVSSTSPTDGATGTAVDAAITVTFNEAMGLASFVAGETVTVRSTGTTSTAFDDVITISGMTLNSAGTTLTIAHTADDFGGTTEYQVILSNVRNSSGVPLAAPYQFTFTTT